jgi:hypothetical protein
MLTIAWSRLLGAAKGLSETIGCREYLQRTLEDPRRHKRQ